MKKLLAVILSLSLLLAVVPFSTVAATPVDSGIVLSAVGAPETVYPGSEFDIKINISNNSGIYAWRADLVYDDDVFTLVSCTSTDEFANEYTSIPRFSYKDSNGNVRLLWDAADKYNFEENGTIATLRFKVKDPAASGDYTFDLVALDASKVINTKPFAQSVSYTANDCETTLDQIRVSTVEIVDIDAKTEYYIGDTLDIESITLKATYNNGTIENVTEGYNTSYDFTSAGAKNVTVTYGGATASFPVTVISPEITLSDYAETIIAKNTYTITATTIPQNVEVNWTSNNESVATVANGVVTAKAEGEATITASFTYNGISYKAESVITVIPIVITGIEITDIDVKEEYYIDDELVINDISITVTYNNGNTEIVTGGYDTSYDFSTAGTKTVTVSYGGFSDTFEVNVETPSITLSDNEKIVILDKTYRISADTLPEGVNVVWESEDQNIATVEDGVVTAKAEGETTITASFVYNGTTYKASCVVTVKKLLGDINDDGVVNTTDLAQLKLHLVGATVLENKALAVADVSQDGAVDTTDLALMKLYLAGVFSDFEANNR